MVLMIISSILVILFIVLSIMGRKYDELFEGLEGAEFPLKSIYCIGFVLKKVPILDIPAKLYENMLGQAKLVYEQKYAEYYVNVVWSQSLSFMYFITMIGFVISGLTNTIFFALIGIGFGMFSAYFFYSSMQNKLKERGLECTTELPEVVSTMALLINSGMVLKEAWETVAYNNEGEIYDLMKRACVDMENGMSETDAIYNFGLISNSAEIKKFTSSIIQGVEKGSSELSNVLVNQSTEMWDLKRQIMLQKGEAAASKLIGPIGLIFVGIIILVVAGIGSMLTI